ncbi:MAG: cytochrome b/b6 domain-containing protein [Candidatus Tectomicrobia bacterium]|uniref:Cytochrome b/b6 domain-containing protein n=1 Tax=Tectimicrobiota bacterium TaxID=2528274 RepID=A0A932I0L1_UNCTE|nr:cytochrome b/b6 domain-containing protein [Candidatus Tectomicrobia bacterium]
MMPPEEKDVREEEGSVLRFTRRQRLEHHIMAALFILLTVTGLPQKFSDAFWAGSVVRLIGDLDLMRWLHRMAGFAFGGFTVYFLVFASLDVLRGRAALSMAPFLSDLREVYRGLLWAAGLGPRPAAGRFDYREKLEFWGMLLGSGVMILTGLILYFPIQATRWLPGQVIPVAKTAHSYEAMLALMVIVVWHLYNAMFRPGVFPLDTTIIHGRMSLGRLREEHPLEFERLFPEKAAEEGEEERPARGASDPSPA